MLEPIKDTDRYFVTSAGAVYNVRGRKLRPTLMRSSGYLHIKLLYTTGGYKDKLVHRLVAEAYLPNPDFLPEVNHKNGDKTDNRVENLEWVDRSENMRHAYRNGLHSHQKSVEAYTYDGRLVKTFKSVNEAAAYCGVNYNSGISHCLRGRARTAHGYVWKYAPGGADP